MGGYPELGSKRRLKGYILACGRGRGRGADCGFFEVEDGGEHLSSVRFLVVMIGKAPGTVKGLSAVGVGLGRRDLCRL